MNKLALALLGVAISATATAQTDGTLAARSSVVANVITIAAPLVLLAVVTVAAESNNTPSTTIGGSGPATSP